MRTPSSALALLLAIALGGVIPSSSAVAAGDQPREERMDVERLWTFSRVAAPSVSPDGRWVAFTLTRFELDTNASDSDIWIIPADGSRRARALTSGPDVDSLPRFSPDSRRLAFLTRKDDTPQRVRIVDLFGGEPQPATALPVPVKRFAWMPDGKRLVVEIDTWPDLGGRFDAVAQRIAEQKADKTQARITDSRVLRYWDHYLTDGRAPALFELNLATGGTRELTRELGRLTGFEGFEWDLAPDGGEIAFSANSTASPFRALNFDVYALDVATGRTTNLTPDSPGADTRPTYAHRSRQLLIARTRRPEVGSEQDRLFLLDRHGPAREVAAALDSGKGDFRFTGDDRGAVFAADQQGRTPLFQASFQRDGVDVIVEGGTATAPDVVGDSLVYLKHDFGHPSELHHYDLKDGFDRRLTGFNDSRVPPLGKVEALRYQGAGGATVHTWLVWPPDARAGQPLPLLVLAHGGPFSAWNDGFSYRWNPHVFAARGYLVAMPNFHGSTGYGQAFADSILGNHGEKPAADVLALVDVLKRRGAVDGDRIAIAGGSYGGYLTALVMGMSAEFRAAIVHAGVFTISAQFASDSHWDRPSSYGNAPWTDPTELDRWSPSRFVPRMDTPTLILHGEKDYRVPVTQGINLHGALSGKGVPARIVVFPDENHWILKPQASRLWHREFFAWLDRWMAPGTPRWRTDAPTPAAAPAGTSGH